MRSLTSAQLPPPGPRKTGEARTPITREHVTPCPVSSAGAMSRLRRDRARIRSRVPHQGGEWRVGGAEQHNMRARQNGKGAVPSPGNVPSRPVPATCPQQHTRHMGGARRTPVSPRGAGEAEYITLPWSLNSHKALCFPREVGRGMYSRERTLGGGGGMGRRGKRGLHVYGDSKTLPSPSMRE